MADDAMARRLKTIINTSNALKRTYADHVDLRVAKFDGGSHASTGGHDANVRVTVNEDWASGVTDNRIKATLYHEGVHTTQRKRTGFMTDSTKAQREFHAHTEELRKAMKHNLYSASDKKAKLAKIDKYYEQVQAEGSFKLFDDQYKRIQQGHAPSKITTKDVHQALNKMKKP